MTTLFETEDGTKIVLTDSQFASFSEKFCEKLLREVSVEAKTQLREKLVEEGRRHVSSLPLDIEKELKCEVEKFKSKIVDDIVRQKLDIEKIATKIVVDHVLADNNVISKVNENIRSALRDWSPEFWSESKQIIEDARQKINARAQECINADLPTIESEAEEFTARLVQKALDDAAANHAKALTEKLTRDIAKIVNASAPRLALNTAVAVNIGNRKTARKESSDETRS